MNRLYLDCDPSEQPEGSYRHLLNGSKLENEVGISISKGSSLFYDFTSLNIGTIVKTLEINNVLYIFSKNGNTCKIGYIENGIYTNNYTFENGILLLTSEMEVNYKVIDNIVYLYILNNKKIYKFKLELNNVIVTDLNKYLLFKEILKVPNCIPTYFDSGGKLVTGAYVFFIQYTNQDYKSNWIEVTRPIYVTGVNRKENVVTGSSIKLSFTNIDLSFDYINIAYVKDNGECKIIDKISTNLFKLNNGLEYYLFTGFEQMLVSSLEELLINNNNYLTVESTSVLDNKMYLGGLNTTNNFDLDYQKYANNIKVKAKLKPIASVVSSDNSEAKYSRFCKDKLDGTPYTSTNLSELKTYGNGVYKDPNTIYLKGTFRRGDVYAFYIYFVLKDGSLSQKYHIPGRDILEGRGELNNSSNNIISNEKKFHTSSEYTTVGSYDPLVVQSQQEVYPECTLSYWENEIEKYPDLPDYDIWDVVNGVGVTTNKTLRYKNVRHHKIPEGLPIFYSSDGNSIQSRLYGIYHGHVNSISGFDIEEENSDTYFARQKGAFLIELSFYDIKIPNEIKEQVIGYRIAYAVRTVENRIKLDQCLLHVNADKLVDTSQTSPYTNDAFYLTPFKGPHLTENPATNNFSISPYFMMTSLQYNLPYSEITNITHLRRNSRISTCYSTYLDSSLEQTKIGLNFDPSLKTFNLNNDISSINVDTVTSFNKKIVAPEYYNYFTSINPFATNPFENPVFPEYIVEVNYRTYKFIGEQGLTNLVAPQYNLEKDGIFQDYIYLETVSGYTGEGNIVDICCLKNNVYFPFYLQKEFIWSGKTYDKNQTSTEFETFGDCYPVLYHSQTFVDVPDAVNINQISSRVHSYVVESDIPYLNYFDKPEYPYIDWTVANGDTGARDLLECLNLVKNEFSFNLSYMFKRMYKFSTVYYNSFNLTDKSYNISVSEKQDESNFDNWTIHKPLNNIFIGSEHGKIVKLVSYNGNLLIHCEKSLLITRGKEELQIEDIRAFVGSGDIFAQEPKEIEKQNLGLDSKNLSLYTPLGYFWINKKTGFIYRLFENLENITSIGSGIYTLLPKLVRENKFKYMTYDYNTNRLIFQFDTFYISYLCSLTKPCIWEGFFTIEGNVLDFGYSINNQKLYKLFNGNYGYNDLQRINFELSVVDILKQHSMLEAVYIDFNKIENNVFTSTNVINTIRIHNNKFDTGDKNISSLKSRYVRSLFNISGFRQSYPTDNELYNVVRLKGNYFIIDIKETSQNLLNYFYIRFVSSVSKPFAR